MSFDYPAGLLVLFVYYAVALFVYMPARELFTDGYATLVALFWIITIPGFLLFALVLSAISPILLFEGRPRRYRSKHRVSRKSQMSVSTGS